MPCDAPLSSRGGKTTTRLGVGIDLVAHDEVRQAILVQGRRYLRRVYSAAERAQWGEEPRQLALCFAAKEATMKALRRQGEALAWREIELLGPRRRPEVRLSGAAAELARSRGVERIELGVGATGTAAMAVAVAVAGVPGGGRSRGHNLPGSSNRP